LELRQHEELAYLTRTIGTVTNRGNSNREMKGGPECPLTPTPPLMAALTRSRLVSVVGKESVQR